MKFRILILLASLSVVGCPQQSYRSDARIIAWCATEYGTWGVSKRSACGAAKVFASKYQAQAEHQRMKKKTTTASTSTSYVWCATDVSVIKMLESSCRSRNGEVFLTEKIWKAVMAKHIFVIHGNLNYLETFRSLGFKTFSDYFDEGYDTEMHKKTRMEKIKKTCISLQSMDWEDLYKQTQALRQHNYETFFDGEKLSVQVNKTLELFLEFADGSQVPSRES